MKDYKKKYEIIGNLVKGEITRKEASFSLNLKIRQIDRLKAMYKKGASEDDFKHKNTGKIPVNKIDTKTIDELEELYMSDYYDFNLTAFYEKINEIKKYKEKYGNTISYPSLHNLFLNDDIISPLAHKETSKLYYEKLNNAIQTKNNISPTKIELYETRKLSIEKAFIRRSCDIYKFGQEVQMDASPERWFAGCVTHLHLAVDKATKKVLFGWFEFEETTRAYFILLYNIIINYGIPAKIKTDNRTTFSNQNSNVETTKFGIICRELGIELITSSVPTFKANVERENKTFKGRLIAELRLEKIKNIDEANKFLNEVFIPKMNSKFSYKINYSTSMMKVNSYSKLELNLIISERYTRIIDNASSIKYDNNHYIPYDNNTGEVVPFKKNTKCEFIIDYNYEYWCKIENHYYKLQKLETRDKKLKKENTNEISSKLEYIPPKNL